MDKISERNARAWFGGDFNVEISEAEYAEVQGARDFTVYVHSDRNFYFFRYEALLHYGPPCSKGTVFSATV